ncbi:MAG: Npt1/Npt2 family nucleotide transporter [Gammaproteobacteria bacterium]
MNQSIHHKTVAIRSLSLFANFFFIILAYYLVKPASRSIFLDYFSAEQLPYVWIGSALLLGLFMPVYNRIVERIDRRHLVAISCLLFSLFLSGFYLLFHTGHVGPVEAVAFYIFIDILSVMLVEQFWSLTNSSYISESGSRWYGLVGSGGLAGGLVGGALASWLLNSTSLVTYDMLLVSALMLIAIGFYTWLLTRTQIYTEKNVSVGLPGVRGFLSIRELLGNRYMALIITTLLLAQFVEPIVEYQFMSYVEAAYTDRDLRTAFLSSFLSILGGFALFINLLMTPLILRKLGTLAGMLVQPILLMITAGIFNANPGLLTGAIMKIGDRGLSYSINRAAKEMLYIPVNPILTYRAKAWIDMFGYRLFKIVGSMVLLALTQWFNVRWAPADFSLLVIPACLLWTGVVLALRRDYGLLRRKETLLQSVVSEA